MSKILTMNENKEFLKYHNKTVPNTIHNIKKKALKLMIKALCKTNCDINDNYKHFLSILHRKKIISPNNKCMNYNTSKLYINHKKCFDMKQTRTVLFNYHF
jgi:hypothetical protein